MSDQVRIVHLFTEAATLTHRARIMADAALGSIIDAAHSTRRFMKSIDELNTKIAELKQAIIDDEEQDAANEAALQQIITDLRAQVASGTTDFEAQFNALEELKGQLKSPTSATTDTGTEGGTPE